MRGRFILTCCASLGALGWSDAGLAQQQAPGATTPAAGEDGDIVVTARRVAESLQSVPLAVTALGGEALQRASVREIRDLSGVVPNLNVSAGNIDPGTVVFVLRGQTPTNAGILSIDSPVGVYFDGGNIPRDVGLRSGLVDIQRVEVLRGPQGTLYGRNTTGGAVSIVTKDPTDKLGGSAQLTGGNYDMWNVLGVLNLPLAEGLGLRLVGQRSAHDGYGHEVLTGRDLLDEHSTYVRAKLKYDGGGFKATLTADAFRYRSGGQVIKLTGLVPATSTTPAGGAGLAEIARVMFNLTAAQAPTAAQIAAASTEFQSYVNRGSFYNSYTNSPQYSRSKGHSATLSLEQTLSDFLTLRSISSYRYFKSARAIDSDGTPYPIVLASGGTPYDRFYSEEAQLIGSSKAVSFVVGGFYSYERGKDFTTSAARLISSANTLTIQEGILTSESYALFGQGSWHFAPGWSLTLGGRWTHERKGVINRNRTTAGCGVPVVLRSDPAVCEADLNDNFKKPTWLASIDYKFTPDVLGYAKISRGFRGGGQNERGISPPGGAVNVAPFLSFRPEVITEYELGLKSELFDRHLRLNLAAFWDDYKDVQRTATVLLNGSTASIATNAASARLYGLEGEANLRLTDRLSLNGSFGYLNAKYKTFIDALLGDRTYEKWPAPKWTYAVGPRYRQPTNIGAFDLNVDWNWRSDLSLIPYSRQIAQTTQKAFGLLNARAAIAIDGTGLVVAAFGRNLLQKHYFTNFTGVEGLGFNAGMAGEPRVLGVQLTAKFGGE